jgi:NADPH:quinone reductase-like Zn-dependent oxidoreductase
MASVRRVVFRHFGDVSVLEEERVPSIAPGPGEIAVDVAFAGVNYADVLARRGFYKWAPPPPTCVGFEVAGTVSAIGPDVTEHAVGDRILAITRFGGYASRVIVEAARAFRLPASMSLDKAAAIPAVYLTAWHSLFEIARVRPGESLLIQAVGGGVGLAALQLAKHHGLVTYGTASSAEKLALAKEHGLDHGIDYARTDFEAEIARLTDGRGVDVVLDSLGGEGLKKGYRALARCGRLVTIGAAQVAPTSRRDPIALVRAGVELLRGGVFHPFQLIEDNKSIAGVQVLLLWDDLPRVRRGLEAVLSLYDLGKIHPHIDRIVPLALAHEAHLRLETRASKGKLLLDCRAS